LGRNWQVAATYLNPLAGKKNMNTTEIIIVYLPSITLVVLWLNLKEKNKKKTLFTAISIVLLFVLGFYGWNTHKENHEISKLGSSLLIPSPTIPAVLLLNAYFKKKLTTKIWVPFCLLMPPIAMIACFFVLAFTGQIWGM